MNSQGTIDQAGFRTDLAAISQNDYPPLQLVKLPFNWYTPQTAGILQHTMQFEAILFPNNVTNGSTLLILIGLNPGGVANPSVLTVTDSQGNVYTQVAVAQEAFFGREAQAYICLSAIGGATTVTITTNQGYVQGVEGLEIGGCTGVEAANGEMGHVGLGGTTAGNYVFSFAAAGAGTPGEYPGWTQSSGWTQLDVDQPNGTFTLASYQISPGTGLNNVQVLTGWTGNAIPQIMISLDIVPGGTGTPPVITPITLPGPCNFIALVSEAIDEQGLYHQSGLIGQQAAAGFLRLNGQGSIWIPISFADPLMAGYVTTNDNYSVTPLAGTGFQAIEGPFHQLEWRPAIPVTYAGSTPPATPAGYLLAFVGVNVGVGGKVGAGDGSTHAIPSSAGPVERLKKAGLL